MGKFEEVMSKMELKKPPKDVWRLYWTSVYNRLERRIGWILLSIGAMIILFFGGYKMVVVVLLVSLIREQFFVRKRERYKEVER
jgi:hypothetical protein